MPNPFIELVTLLSLPKRKIVEEAVAMDHESHVRGANVFPISVNGLSFRLYLYYIPQWMVFTYLAFSSQIHQSITCTEK